MKTETYQALVNVAGALVDSSQNDQLKIAFDRISDWQELVDQAEIHGLSVMLGRLAANGDISIPRELDLQLKALTIRHKKVLEARRIVLAEVIDILQQHDISFAFLKGAALSHLVYIPPWLRPMRDIDLLVAKKNALLTQQLLRDIGFQNEDYVEGYLFEHHHLPNSTRIQNGFTISVEVHHDALSGDVGASITLDNLADELQPFRFADRTAWAFGHQDMLKHLCHHTFEPAGIIKLGSMVDMLRYASFFVDEIDWQNLDKTQPGIVNALRCIDALISLPSSLREKLLAGMPDRWQPTGTGRGFLPLSYISRLNDNKEKVRQLLMPSEWWMHIFYGVPPGKSLFFTRAFRHPATIAKWLWRRYRAARNSREITQVK